MNRKLIKPVKYLLGPVTIAGTTAVMVAIQASVPFGLNVPIVVLAYLLAINVVTQLGGFVPGVLSAAAAFLCFNYFFIDPRGSLRVSNEIDLVVLVLFLIVAMVNSQLLAVGQRQLLESELRERNAALFYQFSLDLISAPSRQAVASTLSRRLAELLRIQYVRVQLHERDGEAAVLASVPDATKTNRPPDCAEPITSTRGQLGEVTLWCDGSAFTTGERNLIRTFAGQVALIIDRLDMSERESKTRLLEESDRLKSLLLSSISHELRTPLATIRAGTESLSGGLVALDSAVGRDLISDVNEAAQHLTQLVDNTLDMTRIESGALFPNREWTELADIVNSSRSHLRGLLAHHIIQTDIPDDLPLIPVDPIRIDQVFTNLISNSVKYAPPATPIEIRAEVQPEDGMLLVQVCNQSPSLTEQDLNLIFDKFHRVTRAKDVIGTGLGLSICKGIIEAHQGRIWAANAPGAGRGLIFNFTLPLSWNGAHPKLPPVETEA